MSDARALRAAEKIAAGLRDLFTSLTPGWDDDHGPSRSDVRQEGQELLESGILDMLDYLGDKE